MNIIEVDFSLNTFQNELRSFPYTSHLSNAEINDITVALGKWIQGNIQGTTRKTFLAEVKKLLKKQSQDTTEYIAYVVWLWLGNVHDAILKFDVPQKEKHLYFINKMYSRI